MAYANDKRLEEALTDLERRREKVGDPLAPPDGALFLQYLRDLPSPLAVTDLEVKVARAEYMVADSRLQKAETEVDVIGTETVREFAAKAEALRLVYEQTFNQYVAAANHSLAKAQHENAEKAARFNWLVGVFVIIAGLGAFVQAGAAAWQAFSPARPQPVNVTCTGSK